MHYGQIKTGEEEEEDKKRSRWAENEEIIVKDKRGVGTEAVIKKESKDEPDMSDRIGVSGNFTGVKAHFKGAAH